jgi:hypothetical protein
MGNGVSSDCVLYTGTNRVIIDSVDKSVWYHDEFVNMCKKVFHKELGSNPTLKACLKHSGATYYKKCPKNLVILEQEQISQRMK